MRKHRDWVTMAAAVLCLAMSSARAEKPQAPDEVPGTTRVSAEQVVELMTSASPPVVIDSRRREEFDKGHIEGAFSLLDTAMTRAQLARLAAPPATPLLFYCNGEYCLRSSHAAQDAVAWGYRKVFWFRGGWQEWTDKHLPVSH